MARIRVLSETVVNRIAAGEVIERPAAAVKELVENALDAGATRVAVTLAGGGIDRIEVTDDGAGMAAADLALAVLRHATSKLSDESLVRIATLGFRGEALPSIGAAARLEITSRPQDADHACQIRVEGGQVTPVSPAAGPPGTRVVVRDLFFATPARRKFLKQPRTEGEHAEAAVLRLALAAPAVAFRLENEGRIAYDLPSQDRASRVAALLGPEAAAAMMPVRHERGGLAIEGYACSPAITRATAAAQFLVVNGRPVTDPMLKAAVRVAYRDVIAHGRYPVVALFLAIPPEELDVNVHPAKTEVRFRDANAVRSLVIGGIQRGLAGLGTAAGDAATSRLPEHRPSLRLAYSRPPSSGIRALPLPGFTPGAHAGGRPGDIPAGGRPPGWSGPAWPGPAGPGYAGPGYAGPGYADPGYGAPGHAGQVPPGHVPPGQAPLGHLPRGQVRAGQGQAAPNYPAALAPTGYPDPAHGAPLGVADAQWGFAGPPAARVLPPPPPPNPAHPLGAAIAQVLDTYILAVAADGALVLVDQHAAHERLTHEAIRAQMLAGGVRSQPLLLPAVVDLPRDDAARLAERAEDLRGLGLEIEAFGPGAILVRAMPAELGVPEPAPLLRDLADELAELGETTALQARLDAVIARLACHGSIRAGRRLAQPEMDALLRRMEADPRAATCSHGRPTFLKLSRAEIEKLFGRR
jgi:DNA mismatch repair protein MutL